MDRIKGFRVYKDATTITVEIELVCPGLEIDSRVTTWWPRNCRKSFISAICLGPRLQFPDLSPTGSYRGPELPRLKQALYETIIEAIGDELNDDMNN